MPTIQERLEERDPAELRALQRHSLGFMQLGGETCVMIELTGRDPVSGESERHSFVVSLAGAVTLCADLTNVIESDAGILALVRSTLADAQRMKPRPEPDSAAARCGVVLCERCCFPVDDHVRGVCPGEEDDHGPTHCSHLGNRLPGQCPHCPDSAPEEG